VLVWSHHKQQLIDLIQQGVLERMWGKRNENEKKDTSDSSDPVGGKKKLGGK
jgi:hypothetical protein